MIVPNILASSPENVKYENNRYFKYGVCPGCNYARWVRIDRKAELERKETFYCRSCAVAKVRASEPLKGSYFIDKGYAWVSITGDSPYFSMCNKHRRHKRSGYILEHRLVYAQHLERCLETREVIHHLNGRKTDNRLVNLSLRTNGTHDKYSIRHSMEARIRELEDKIEYST